jgi:hypothetical protein
MLATNVLALPQAHLIIEVANNEDWIDSLVFLVSGSEPEPEPERRAARLHDQLDLRGIVFTMHVRRRPQDNEIVLTASTADGSLSIGAPPNVGHLIFYLPQAIMRQQWPGKYVGDVSARDANFERVCLTLDLTIIEGITR